MKETYLLIILDGWACGKDEPGNAVVQANTPQWDRLIAHHPHRSLEAAATAVGLPSGQMGNSEVGHLNLGAGRVVLQTLLRINKAIADGSFARQPTLHRILRRPQGRLHLVGLLSAGGVHSHQDHLFALCRLAATSDIKDLSVHIFLDGRDTAPTAAAASLAALEEVFKETGVGHLSSICGRYYAMDRDKRWERTEQAYRLLVEGEATRQAEDAAAALAAVAAAGETDEFVRPTFIVGGTPIAAADSILCVNFRADRMRQLVAALMDPQFSSFARPFVLSPRQLLTMIPYSEDSPVPYIYGKEVPADCLGEVLARHGKTQLRLAETEKFAHVTYFFNGGREKPFAGEDRQLLPSLKVATYDLAPQMRAPDITEELVTALAAARYDFILCNYANGDMVGHTGNLSATIQAVETLDLCLGQVLTALTETGSEALITADHGNCERMLAAEGDGPHTAHTMNPVPLIYYGKQPITFHQHEQAACLADIAPTLLKLMHIPQPAAMTGHSLL